MYAVSANDFFGLVIFSARFRAAAATPRGGGAAPPRRGASAQAAAVAAGWGGKPLLPLAATGAVRAAARAGCLRTDGPCSAAAGGWCGCGDAGSVAVARQDGRRTRLAGPTTARGRAAARAGMASMAANAAKIHVKRIKLLRHDEHDGGMRLWPSASTAAARTAL